MSKTRLWIEIPLREYKILRTMAKLDGNTVQDQAARAIADMVLREHDGAEMVVPPKPKELKCVSQTSKILL